MLPAADCVRVLKRELPIPSIGLLLEAGANGAARNAEGKTPWDLAQDNEILKESGRSGRFRACASGSLSC